jgi:protein-S-isoprenylcysteine O-methyltransferase Ste14
MRRFWNTRRFCGITFGVVAQGALLATLWPLFRFLRNDYASAAPAGPLWIDAVAALQFAVPHSLLLYPATRARITRWLRSELYGALFCLSTCMGLWATMAMWRGSAVVIWAWPAALQPAVQAAFLGAWGALFYSLNLTGLGYQTGFTPWWHWVRGRPVPRREFQARGAFRYLRHPAYFCFLGLVWLTPVVTADRAVLIGIWTCYVFVGSHLKDERMARLLGDPYRRYQAEVPGFPLMWWGPLARRPLAHGALACRPLAQADR